MARRPYRGNTVGALFPQGLGDLAAAQNQKIAATRAVSEELKNQFYQYDLQADNLLIIDKMNSAQQEYQRRLREEAPDPTDKNYMKYTVSLQNEVFKVPEGEFATRQGKNKARILFANLQSGYATEAGNTRETALNNKEITLYNSEMQRFGNEVVDRPDDFESIYTAMELAANEFSLPQLRTKEAAIARQSLLHGSRVTSLIAKGRFADSEMAIKDAKGVLATKDYMTLKSNLATAREKKRKAVAAELKANKAAAEKAQGNEQDLYLANTDFLISAYENDPTRVVEAKKTRSDLQRLFGTIQDGSFKLKVATRINSLNKYIRETGEDVKDEVDARAEAGRNQWLNDAEISLTQIEATGGAIAHNEQLQGIKRALTEFRETEAVKKDKEQDNKAARLIRMAVKAEKESFDLITANTKVNNNSKRGFGTSQADVDKAYKYHQALQNPNMEEVALDLSIKSGHVPSDIQTLLETAGNRNNGDIHANARALASAARLSTQLDLNRVGHETNEYVILTKQLAGVQGIEEEEAAIQVLGQVGNADILDSREKYWKGDEGLGKKFRTPHNANSLVKDALGEGWFTSVDTNPQILTDFTRFAKSAWLATGNEELALEVAGKRTAQLYGESEVFGRTLKHNPEKYLDIKHPDLVQDLDDRYKVWVSEEMKRQGIRINLIQGQTEQVVNAQGNLVVRNESSVSTPIFPMWLERNEAHFRSTGERTWTLMRLNNQGIPSMLTHIDGTPYDFMNPTADQLGDMLDFPMNSADGRARLAAAEAYFRGSKIIKRVGLGDIGTDVLAP